MTSHGLHSMKSDDDSVHHRASSVKVETSCCSKSNIDNNIIIVTPSPTTVPTIANTATATATAPTTATNTTTITTTTTANTTTTAAAAAVSATKTTTTAESKAKAEVEAKTVAATTTTTTTNTKITTATFVDFNHQNNSDIINIIMPDKGRSGLQPDTLNSSATSTITPITNSPNSPIDCSKSVVAVSNKIEVQRTVATTVATAVATTVAAAAATAAVVAAAAATPVTISTSLDNNSLNEQSVNIKSTMLLDSGIVISSVGSDIDEMPDKNQCAAKTMRRVSFPENDKDLVTGYLEPKNPWQSVGQVADVSELVELYKSSCRKHNAPVMDSMVKHIRSLNIGNGERVCHLNLQEETLTPEACEALEEIFKRVQYRSIDLTYCGLDDAAATTMFEMIEYYEAANELDISYNGNITSNGWQACINMIKKSIALRSLSTRSTPIPYVHGINLGKAMASSSLHTLKLVHCGISGRPLLSLCSALSKNTILRELSLAHNDLSFYDCYQISMLLKSNFYLQLLDISYNNIEDMAGSIIILALVEQSSNFRKLWESSSNENTPVVNSNSAGNEKTNVAATKTSMSLVGLDKTESLKIIDKADITKNNDGPIDNTAQLSSSLFKSDDNKLARVCEITNTIQPEPMGKESSLIAVFEQVFNKQTSEISSSPKELTPEPISDNTILNKLSNEMIVKATSEDVQTATVHNKSDSIRSSTSESTDVKTLKTDNNNLNNNDGSSEGDESFKNSIEYDLSEIKTGNIDDQCDNVTTNSESAMIKANTEPELVIENNSIDQENNIKRNEALQEKNNVNNDKNESTSSFSSVPIQSELISTSSDENRNNDSLVDEVFHSTMIENYNSPPPPQLPLAQVQSPAQAQAQAPAPAQAQTEASVSFEKSMIEIFEPMKSSFDSSCDNSGNSPFDMGCVEPFTPERSFSLESLNSETSLDSNDSKSSIKLAETKFIKNGTLERQTLANANDGPPLTIPTGLQVLILWNNRLTRKSAEFIAELLAVTTTLEILNIGRNVLSNEFLTNIKTSLISNTSLTNLGLQNAHLTCPGIDTLAEILQNNRNATLQRIDLRDNNIQVPGLVALTNALKTNKIVTRIDIDDFPKRSIDGDANSVSEYTKKLNLIRSQCNRNESPSEPEPAVVRSNVRQARTGFLNSRKISLTCQNIKSPAAIAAAATADTIVNSRTHLDPHRKSTSRLRSPLPSPIPSPVASPVPSPSRSRFQVSRVTESSSPVSPVTVATKPITSATLSGTITSTAANSTSISTQRTTMSRFRVTIVEPAKNIVLETPKAVTIKSAKTESIVETTRTNYPSEPQPGPASSTTASVISVCRLDDVHKMNESIKVEIMVDSKKENKTVPEDVAKDKQEQKLSDIPPNIVPVSVVTSTFTKCDSEPIIAGSVSSAATAATTATTTSSASSTQLSYSQRNVSGDSDIHLEQKEKRVRKTSWISNSMTDGYPGTLDKIRNFLPIPSVNKLFTRNNSDSPKSDSLKKDSSTISGFISWASGNSKRDQIVTLTDDGNSSIDKPASIDLKPKSNVLQPHTPIDNSVGSGTATLPIADPIILSDSVPICLKQAMKENISPEHTITAASLISTTSTGKMHQPTEKVMFELGGGDEGDDDDGTPDENVIPCFRSTDDSARPMPSMGAAGSGGILHCGGIGQIARDSLSMLKNSNASQDSILSLQSMPEYDGTASSSSINMTE